MFVDTDHDGLASLADLIRAVTNDPGGLTASYLGLDTKALDPPAVSDSTKAQRAAFSDGVGEQLQYVLNWDANATCKHLDRACLDVPTFCELFHDPHPPPPLRAVCWQEDTSTRTSKKNMGEEDGDVPNDDDAYGEAGEAGEAGEEGEEGKDHFLIEDPFEQQEDGEPGSTPSVGEAILAPPPASAPPATSTSTTSDAQQGRMRTFRKTPSRFSVRVMPPQLLGSGHDGASAFSPSSMAAAEPSDTNDWKVAASILFDKLAASAARDENDDVDAAAFDDDAVIEMPRPSVVKAQLRDVLMCDVKACEALGVQQDIDGSVDDDLDALFQSIDIDNSESIEWSEFLAFFAGRRGDRDRLRTMSRHDSDEIMKSWRPTSLDDIQTVFDEMDIDGDGIVDVDEFKSAIERRNKVSFILVGKVLAYDLRCLICTTKLTHTHLTTMPRPTTVHHWTSHALFGSPATHVCTHITGRGQYPRIGREYVRRDR